MPALSYVSCLLTIVSTVLVGRRLWQGWVVAGVNSLIISAIGWQTAQWGLVPANLFCLAIYAYNLKAWRQPAAPVPEAVAGDGRSPTASLSASLNAEAATFHRPRVHGARAGDERLTSDRIRPRLLPHRREPRPSF